MEVCIGTCVGNVRNYSCVSRGARDNGGQCDPVRYLEQSIDGALAEVALSKFLNKRWMGCHNYHNDADVGTSEEVRAVREEHKNLLIRPCDALKKHRRFWLLIGTNHLWRICGYYNGDAAMKRDDWKTKCGNNRSQCWLVPRNELRWDRFAQFIKRHKKAESEIYGHKNNCQNQTDDKGKHHQTGSRVAAI